MRTGSHRKGQDGNLGPVHHGAGGQVEKEDEDGAAGAEPGVEREVLLVSRMTLEPTFPIPFPSILPLHTQGHFVTHVSFFKISAMRNKNVLTSLKVALVCLSLCSA